MCSKGELPGSGKIRLIEAEVQLLYKCVVVFNDMQVMEAEMESLARKAKGEGLRRNMDAYTCGTRGLAPRVAEHPPGAD